MEGAGTMLAVAVGPHSQHGIILALLTTNEEEDDGKCVGGNVAWITRDENHSRFSPTSSV